MLLPRSLCSSGLGVGLDRTSAVIDSWHEDSDHTVDHRGMNQSVGYDQSFARCSACFYRLLSDRLYLGGRLWID